MPAESLIDHHDLALPATLLSTLRAFAPLRCPEPPTHYELRGKVALTRHSGLVPDREGGMESARIKLDPQTVEAIARRAVELLEARGLQKRGCCAGLARARRLTRPPARVSGQVSLRPAEGAACGLLPIKGPGDNESPPAA